MRLVLKINTVKNGQTKNMWSAPNLDEFQQYFWDDFELKRWFNLKSLKMSFGVIPDDPNRLMK